jgi:hypothetical protein
MGRWIDIGPRTSGYGCGDFQVVTSWINNVAKPEIGPDWTLRLQLQFLFPKCRGRAQQGIEGQENLC